MNPNDRILSVIKKLDSEHEEKAKIILDFVNENNERIAERFGISYDEFQLVYKGYRQARVVFDSQSRSKIYRPKRISFIAAIIICLFLGSLIGGAAVAAMRDNRLNISQREGFYLVSSYVDGDKLIGHVVPLRYPDTYTITSIDTYEDRILLDFVHHETGKRLTYLFYGEAGNVQSAMDENKDIQRTVIADKQVLYIDLGDGAMYVSVLNDDREYCSFSGYVTMSALETFIANIGVYEGGNNNDAE